MVAPTLENWWSIPHHPSIAGGISRGPSDSICWVTHVPVYDIQTTHFAHYSPDESWVAELSSTVRSYALHLMVVILQSRTRFNPSHVMLGSTIPPLYNALSTVDFIFYCAAQNCSRIPLIDQVHLHVVPST